MTEKIGKQIQNRLCNYDSERIINITGSSYCVDSYGDFAKS